MEIIKADTVKVSIHLIIILLLWLLIWMIARAFGFQVTYVSLIGLLVGAIAEIFRKRNLWTVKDFLSKPE